MPYADRTAFKDSEGNYKTEPDGYTLTEEGRTSIREHTMFEVHTHGFLGEGLSGLHSKKSGYDYMLWDFLYMLNKDGTVAWTRDGWYTKVSAAAKESTQSTGAVAPDPTGSSTPGAGGEK